MIRLTCDNCHTTYQLEAAALGAQGRTVRCTQCRNEWFQKPLPEHAGPDHAGEEIDLAGLEDDAAPEEAFAAPEALPEEDSPQAQEDAAEEEVPEWLRADEPPGEDLDFVPVRKDGRADEDDIPDSLLQSLTPLHGQDQGLGPEDALLYRPMNMGPVQFGLSTFLVLAFTSLLALLAFRGTIMSHAPVMDAFYRPIGLGVKAPGEGLKITGMTAQELAAPGGKHSLSVTAQMANDTDAVIDWPRLRIEALDGKGAVVKTWDKAAGEDAQAVAAQTGLPLELSFDDIPEGVQTVRIAAVAP